MSSIIYNGHEIQDLIINGNQAQLWLNGQKLYPTEEPAPSIDSVTIGSQTWTSKNLAIDDGQGGIYTQTVNYGQGDVVEYYYNWMAAVRVAESIEGWHLPTRDEWTSLIDAAGRAAIAGGKLKSTYGWSSGNGTDDYGFTALPAGRWDSSSIGEFVELMDYGYFWTSTQTLSEYAAHIIFTTGLNINTSSYGGMYNGFSVRLVKD